MGARPVRRAVQRHVEDPLAEAVIADYRHTLTQALLNVKNGKLTVTCM
jgi:ATP-dependent Clp protease ATP-binding subunit ClpA